ncbi:MAG: hypothetical protein ACJ75B_00060 [Flavisolibacter sp.]
MKKNFCFLLVLFITTSVLGQKETFDIARYTAPKNFKKDTKEQAVIYSLIEEKKGSFCVIALYTSSASSGSSEKDFKDKWKEVILSRYPAADADPKKEESTNSDGWKSTTGAAIVQQDSIQFYVFLTVFTGFGKNFSIMANLNDQSYIPLVDALLENIKLDSSAPVANQKTDRQETGTTNSIIGVWSTQDVSIANYVSPSGAFVRSADVSTMEEYEFRADNKYVYKFFGSANGIMYYTETEGEYTTNGKTLSLVPKKRKGGYGTTIKDEKNLLDKPATLDWYIGPNKWDAGPYLNLHQDGKYYMWSDYPYNYFKKVGASTATPAKSDSPKEPEGIQNQAATKDQSNIQTEKFGSVMYKTPNGWTLKKYSNAEILSPADLQQNEFLEIRILQSLNFSGSLEQALQKSYDDAVTMLSATKMYEASGGNYTIQPAKKSFRGWEYIRCSGGIRAGGGDYPPEYGLDVFVMKINDRFERIAIVKSRDKCKLSSYYPSDRLNYYRDIENFLFSLQFADWKDLPVKAGVAAGQGIEGVWEGVTLNVGLPNRGAMLGVELKGTHAIFFSNGQAFFGTKFPIEGLDELNTWIAAENNRRDWGTYRFTNGAGVLKMPYGDIPLRMEKGKLIVTKNKTDHVFIKIPAADGARFNGTYVFSSKDILGNETGKTPTIHFSADGKFTDEGAVSVMYHEYIDCINNALNPGSGTYEVKNNSLLFHYSDGRKIKIAFVGMGYDKNNTSPQTLTVSYNDDVLSRK